MNSLNSVLKSLPQFILKNDADWCMIYDWVEQQCGYLNDKEWDKVCLIYKSYMNDTRY